MIVVNGGICDAHYQQYQARYTGETKRSTRLYDRNWQKIRARWLKLNPFCVFCGNEATEVDHIVNLRDGGTHDFSNLRSLCKSHHSTRTASSGGGFGNPK